MDNKSFPIILFANGRMPPPFFVGGDGISIHLFLKELTRKGFSVHVIGAINPSRHAMPVDSIKTNLNKRKIDFQYSAKKAQFKYKLPYTVQMMPFKNIENEVMKFVSSCQQREVVLLSQLELSPELSRLTRRKGIKIVYFVHDAESENLLTLKELSGYKNARLVFNSQFTKNKFNLFTKNIKNDVIYPPIDKKSYTLKSRVPLYITMINPVKVKGGEIFYKLAETLPKLNFLAVKSWYDPVKDGLHFSNLENVTLWEKQNDIRKVFSVSRFLLVPSQWEEGFGRIAAEALMAGVPVIASEQAGLKEAIGEAGILIKNFRSYKNWQNAILKLIDNPELQKLLSRWGLKYVSKFDIHHMGNKLVRIIPS